MANTPAVHPVTGRIFIFDTDSGKRVWAVPNNSGAFVVPDADGTLYLTLSGAASSISYFGINDQLPFFLRSPLQPVGGLVALRPVDRSTL